MGARGTGGALLPWGHPTPSQPKPLRSCWGSQRPSRRTSTPLESSCGSCPPTSSPRGGACGRCALARRRPRSPPSWTGAWPRTPRPALPPWSSSTSSWTWVPPAGRGGRATAAVWRGRRRRRARSTTTLAVLQPPLLPARLLPTHLLLPLRPRSPRPPLRASRGPARLGRHRLAALTAAHRLSPCGRPRPALRPRPKSRLHPCPVACLRARPGPNDGWTVCLRRAIRLFALSFLHCRTPRPAAPPSPCPDTCGMYFLAICCRHAEVAGACWRREACGAGGPVVLTPPNHWPCAPWRRAWHPA